MNIKKAYYKAFKLLDRNLPTILSCISIGGVFATAYFSTKSAPSIIDKKNQLRFEEETEEVDRELLINIAKEAVPTAISIAITTSGIIMADVINRKRIRGLAKAYSVLQTNFKEYALAATSALGVNANNKIKENLDKKKIAEDSRTHLPNDVYMFVDRYTRQTFPSTLEEVIAAQYTLNRIFSIRGMATLEEYCKLMGIGVVDDAHLLGWDISVGQEFYGYEWIDFINEKHEDEDGTVWYSIEMIYEPSIDGYYRFGDLVCEPVDYTEYLEEDKKTLLG